MMNTTSTMKFVEIQTKINKLAWTCVRAFEPWAASKYGKEARKSHLTRVIGEVVEVGLRMFGERQGWLAWLWEPVPGNDDEGASGASLVVFPGIELRKELVNGRTRARHEGGRTRDAHQGDASRTTVILATTMANIGA